MMKTTSELAKLIATIVDSVGGNDLDACDAVAHLRNGLLNDCDFSRAQPIWYWLNIANSLLAELLPEKAEVFVSPGDRTGPKDTIVIESEPAVAIIIRTVMR